MKTKLGLLAIVLFVGSLLTACSKQVRTDEMTSPSHVTIQAVNGRYQFYVNGEPFFVKGVGLGMQDLDFLQASGANSFRTWGTHNAMQLLDSAHKYNMMVALGLGMGQELHGFDYNDTVAVARQLAKLKADVDTFRNHPSLLCWVAGNELNLGTNGIPVNPKAYDALHDIVGYIHKVDPHHPVTTTFAGVNKDQIRVALEHCPDLDFLSLQVYAGLAAIPELVKAAGITKPYAITEFGPKGHWECPSTAWGREIEEPSAVKAAGISERIQKGIVNDSSGFCIGSYAFVWGQKQERTPTWYGMFLNSMGRVEEARQRFTKALELEPLSIIINANFGYHYYLARQYDQAAKQLTATLEMDPNCAQAHFILGMVYLRQPKLGDAIAELRKAVTLEGYCSRYVAELGIALATAGMHSEASRKLDDLEELSQRRYVSPFWRAILLDALVGRREETLEALEKAYEARDAQLSDLKVDPGCDPLRSNPRFQALLRRMNFPEK